MKIVGAAEAGSTRRGISNNDDVSAPDITQFTIQTVLGKVKPPSRLSRLEWFLLALSSVNMLVGLVFAFIKHASLDKSSDQHIFLSLYWANLIFGVVYISHGIFQEQPFEVLLYILSTIFMGLLILINYLTPPQVLEWSDLRWIRLIISSAVTIPNMAYFAVIAAIQYWRSGYLVMKSVGNLPSYMKMYRLLFAGYSLLIFDIHTAISCIILALDNGLTMTMTESILILGGVCFLGVWMTMGFVAMRMEDKILTVMFIITGLTIIPGTIGHLLKKAFTDIDPHADRYEASLIVATVFWGVTHICVSVIIVIFIYRNYGKGLRQSVYGRVKIADRRVTDLTPLIAQAAETNSPVLQRRNGYDSIA